MEQGPDFWCWFYTTQFSYHCVHPIHAKMFSIQMLLHFSQIVQRVCTLVLFILSVCLQGRIQGGGHGGQLPPLSKWSMTSCAYNRQPLLCFSLAYPIINPRRACARVTVLVLSVCLCVCVFSLFWHLAQSGVQTAVSATSARYGHEI